LKASPDILKHSHQTPSFSTATLQSKVPQFPKPKHPKKPQIHPPTTVFQKNLKFFGVCLRQIHTWHSRARGFFSRCLSYTIKESVPLLPRSRIF